MNRPAAPDTGAILQSTIPIRDLPLTDDHPWFACLCPSCDQVRAHHYFPAPGDAMAVANAAIVSLREGLISRRDADRVMRWVTRGLFLTVNAITDPTPGGPVTP